MDRNIPVKPKVCVIIPNKNGLNHLVYSLPSLMSTSYSNYCCVLVDNNSKDDSIVLIDNTFKNIKVLENKKGKGFASTVNIGIKYALERDADYIAIYNSDIKVLPKWLDVAIDLFSANGNIGLIGYTEISKEKESLFYESDNLKVEYKEVKGLSGCLFICPSRVFKHIGLLDEEYFMYGEDNDYFSQLLKAGYLILQTNIPVWHYGEGSSNGGSFQTTWLTYRNALRYSLKNENLIRVGRMFLSLLNQGCNPFLRKGLSGAFSRRIRRYNKFINFILILTSCGWNILNIIPTIKSRNNAMQRIKTNKIK